MLYKCRCTTDYGIVNGREKSAIRSSVFPGYEGKGQFPSVDNCFGCDSPFIETYNLLDYIRYYFRKLKNKSPIA